jgi:hypothetical protein
VFANLNNVTFGMSGSSQVTASASFAQVPFAASAGSQSVSTGTLIFANSNNVTFGMSGSSQITASISTLPETPFAISAGTQSVSTGTLVFSNSNGVTFGMSGSSQVTASFSQVTHSMLFPASGLVFVAQQAGNSSLYMQPVSAPNVVFSRYGFFVFETNASDATVTVSLSYQFGLYTRNIGTLSLMHSTSGTLEIDVSGTVNSSLNSGYRMVSAPWTSAISAGDYWAGFQTATASAGTNGVTMSGILVSNQASAFSGYMNVASNATFQSVIGQGFFSVATAALPASVGITEIRGSGAQFQKHPVFHLDGTTP